VATAWYRLHPEVVLLQPVSGADADELAAAVPGLFSVQEGQLVVGEARQHEDKLERVSHVVGWASWSLLHEGWGRAFGGCDCVIAVGWACKVRVVAASARMAGCVKWQMQRSLQRQCLECSAYKTGSWW
jgi:hypothetical protein